MVGPKTKMVATNRATNAPLAKIRLLKQKIVFLAKMRRLRPILNWYTFWH